jgi:hypothetical protein
LWPGAGDATGRLAILENQLWTEASVLISPVEKGTNMTRPEGPKARYTAEEASEAYIPHPPAAEELDKVSDAQKLITDEWTGEAPKHGEQEDGTVKGAGTREAPP